VALYYQGTLIGAAKQMMDRAPDKLRLPQRLFQLALLLSSLLLWSCEQAQTRSVFNGRTMGTTYEITLATENPLPMERRRELDAEIENKLIYINKLMSTYDPESELSTFNEQPPDACVTLALETFEVMSQSKTLFERSFGAFDPTVGPLVELWGFGAQAQRHEVPAPEAIEAARARVGFDALDLNCVERGVLKRLARAVDFSAIAKGFAVDVLSDLLSDSGYPNHLVEVGGELMAQGIAPSGRPWRVAIERPSTSERGLYAVVPLNNLAMATSGDYRNFFTEEGIRYSHTIDPRTGYPVTHRLASVTVLHEHAAMADGWATALNVLGPEAGLTLARQEQLAVLMLEYDGEAFRELTTPNFDAVLDKHR